MKELYIFGGSGHGKVVIEIAELNGYKITGIIADEISKELQSYPSLTEEEFFSLDKIKEVFIAIGNNNAREKIYKKLKVSNALFPTLIHPTATISTKAAIKEGTTVMAGAIINPFSTVGICSIINTGSVVDHDCLIEEFSHIAPNCSIAGTVSIGKSCFIGVGSTVINNITIKENITVGGGSVVVEDLKEPRIYKGNPAK